MKPERFALAATVNDLTQEEHVRDVADFIEFRMDSAENPISQLSEYEGALPIIATNRAKWFGGEANDSGRLDHLFTASKHDAVQMVDIELETARGMNWVIDEFRANDVDTIISFHAFEDTPDLSTLTAIFEDCARYGDIAKVATFAERRSDPLRMLQAVYSATQNGMRVAGISMGEIGSHTRVTAPLYGSELGYAPLESDPSEYAPGQIPIHELASMVETLTVDEDDPRFFGAQDQSVLSQDMA